LGPKIVFGSKGFADGSFGLEPKAIFGRGWGLGLGGGLAAVFGFGGGSNGRRALAFA
jgi:hypothetical protein